MKSCKIIAEVCRNDFRKWGRNYRIYCIAVIILLLTHMYTEGFRTFIQQTGVKMSPWIFPTLFDDKYKKIFLMVPLVILFSDAPFIDKNEPYCLIRMGRIRWCLGQILYIVVSSAVYYAFIIASTIIVNIRYITWQSDWGKVITTLAKTTAAQDLQLDQTVSDKLIDYFSGPQAMWFTFLLLWMSGIFIGFVLMALNVVTQTKTIGVFAALFFLLFDATLDGFAWIGAGNLKWISPVSWGLLKNIRVGFDTYYPSFGYVIGMFLLLYFFMIIVTVVVFRKRTIRVIK